MWLRKKKEITVEQRYAALREFNRLMQAKDEEGIAKFISERLEELPESERECAVTGAYEEYRTTIGQAEAEQWVADRLHLFSSEVRNEIKESIWGGVSEAFGNGGRWKTGRKDMPDNVDEWMDPKAKRRR
jgi:hypothetical protein